MVSVTMTIKQATPKFSNVKESLMLIDSVVYVFRQRTERTACLCSMMSGMQSLPKEKGPGEVMSTE